MSQTRKTNELIRDVHNLIEIGRTEDALALLRKSLPESNSFRSSIVELSAQYYKHIDNKNKGLEYREQDHNRIVRAILDTMSLLQKVYPDKIDVYSVPNEAERYVENRYEVTQLKNRVKNLEEIVLWSKKNKIVSAGLFTLLISVVFVFLTKPSNANFNFPRADSTQIEIEWAIVLENFYTLKDAKSIKTALKGKANLEVLYVSTEKKPFSLICMDFEIADSTKYIKKFITKFPDATLIKPIEKFGYFYRFNVWGLYSNLETPDKKLAEQPIN